MGARAWQAALVVVVVASVLGGCGGDDDSDSGDSDSGVENGISTADIETSLVDSIGGTDTGIPEPPDIPGAPETPGIPETPSGPAVTDVECPEEVEGATDTEFECDLTGEEGLTGTVTVTLLDDEGTEFDYESNAETEDGAFSIESTGTGSVTSAEEPPA